MPLGYSEGGKEVRYMKKWHDHMSRDSISTANLYFVIINYFLRAGYLRRLYINFSLVANICKSSGYKLYKFIEISSFQHSTEFQWDLSLCLGYLYTQSTGTRLYFNLTWIPNRAIKFSFPFLYPYKSYWSRQYFLIIVKI